MGCLGSPSPGTGGLSWGDGLSGGYGGSRYQVAYGGSPVAEPKPVANPEAEAALLGAMMIDNRLIGQLQEVVTAEDFYEVHHARIFRAMCKFDGAGRVSNPITLKPLFENDSQLAQVGGPGYLAQLTGSGAALIGARDFAAQIRELAGKRKFIAAMDEAKGKVHAGEDAALEDLVALVTDQTADALNRDAAKKPRDASHLIELVKEREARIVNEDAPVGSSCRTISDLNKIVGPLEPGMLIYLAGRPGMGKTTVGVSWAWGLAANSHAVDYYHLEMTELQFGMRLASDVAHGMALDLPHAAIRAGRISQAHMDALDRVHQVVDSLPLRTTHVPDEFIDVITAKVRRSKAYWAKRGRKLEGIFVDYLQLAKARDSYGRELEDDRQRVTAISKALRRVADNEEIWVVGLSQLSRTLEQRADKRPIMSDLRDSGTLEQDADVVLLLYREEYYLKQTEPKKGTIDPKTQKDLHEAWEVEMLAARGKLDIIAGKNRHGEGKTRTVNFYGSHYAVRGGDHYEDDQQDLLL